VWQRDRQGAFAGISSGDSLHDLQAEGRAALKCA